MLSMTDLKLVGVVSLWWKASVATLSAMLGSYYGCDTAVYNEDSPWCEGRGIKVNPTILILLNGEDVGRLEGYVGEAAIMEAVDGVRMKYNLEEKNDCKE